MKLLIVQNSETERPGVILAWAKERQLQIEIVRADLGEAYPTQADLAVVLGAPHHVDDDLPWIEAQRAWLSNRAKEAEPLLALCFGAQLIAEVLGGSVRAAPAAEVGWHEVRFASTHLANPVATLFQWHADEFTPPPNARVLAKSRACANQGFQAGAVSALTSHLEIEADLVEDFIREFWNDDWFAREGRHSPFAQTPDQMRMALAQQCAEARAFAFDFLDLWSEGVFRDEAGASL